ncbi:hypothetical protein LTS15_008090 [Exophiala xenobiotica]|nr:hypothetical protein LTS15_008090 [Exophiala xenobiotica]
MSTSFWLIGVLLAVGVYRVLQIGKRDPRMPKGPPTIPILGNAHLVPPEGLFKQFRSWAKEYGPVFSLKFGPSNMIVLCDRKAIHQLLDKKSSIYSDRPHTYVGHLLTKGDMIALEQMDDHWRLKRKVVAHNFSPKQLDEKHFKVQEAEATMLMADLLNDPKGFYNHIRRYTASVASVLIFGSRGATFDSFWAHGVYDVMSKWTEAMEPGANPPVDEYPFLQWVPRCLAPWKRRAILAGQTMDKVWGEAVNRVQKRRSRGLRRDCITDTLLDEWKDDMPLSQHSFNNLVGELVEGAADTTAAQLLTLVMAFAKNPRVQKRAQEEIDKVCGTERFPLWSDFRDMPYINAIVKEGMRWRPVAVTGSPHRVREDDYYEGMLIPKDSTIIVPVWALHHGDEFDDENDFRPERYLGHSKLANDYAGSPDWANRDHYGYGAGRRICPGMHFAERNMWRVTAKLLWAFEFAEPLDPKTGKVISLDPDAYNRGILQAPLPYDVRVTPRSPRHVQTIEREIAAAKEFLKPWEELKD